MRIHHREFCGTLNHSSSKPSYHHPVTNVKHEAEPFILPLNPGDGRTFPWLSGFAGRFEKYKFLNLSVSYKPTCSTLKGGGVAICPIYDPSDPVPTDRYTLMNAQNVVRGPVYQSLNCPIPRSNLRWNDTMYIREFHAELVDPTEMRTSDLGYIAVVLTDTDPTEEVIENFGDLFVEYTVEMMSPRVGARAAKVCHISSFGQSHPFEAKYPALFHPDTYKSNDRALISPHSTLMVDMDHAADSVYMVGLDDSTPVDYSAITFKEPFSGLMTVTSNNKNTQAQDKECTVVCNGIKLQDEFSEDTLWTLKDGATHQHRFAKVKPLRSIKNGISSAVHTVKVVAQAGETLAMTMAHASQLLDHYAEIVLTEAGPLLLDAMELLVL